MKKIFLFALLFLVFNNDNSFAQEHATSVATAKNSNQFGHEQYGNTLNIGLGIGYYGYIGHSVPMIFANYEFDVAKNFTIAPFVGFYSYANNYYWGNRNNPYRNYTYREIAIPIGVKGTYYFDELLQANNKWDFYLGASAGFQLHTITWERAYYGESGAVRHASSLFLDGHIGTRYHINKKVGLILDLSTGFSTAGISLKP